MTARQITARESWTFSLFDLPVNTNYWLPGSVPEKWKSFGSGSVIQSHWAAA